MRAHIDPLTNEIRQPSPHRLLTGKAILPDPPIIKFSILDCKQNINILKT